MFKCEVTKVVVDSFLQETHVGFRVSTKGSSSSPNHSLVGTRKNNFFLIGEIDKSIKVGDLIRCDGLPFMAKPTPFPRTKKIYQTSSTYLPFQLDSGYWVLRKK